MYVGLPAGRKPVRLNSLHVTSLQYHQPQGRLLDSCDAEWIISFYSAHGWAIYFTWGTNRSVSEKGRAGELRRNICILKIRIPFFWVMTRRKCIIGAWRFDWTQWFEMSGANYEFPNRTTVKPQNFFRTKVNKSFLALCYNCWKINRRRLGILLTQNVSFYEHLYSVGFYLLFASAVLSL